MPDKCRTTAFYAPPESFGPDGRVVLDADETNHLARVLRLKPGAVIELLDGCGGVYEVEYEGIESGRAAGRVISSETFPAPAPKISAAVALGRKERLRTATEKLAELGCGRLWPLECEHLQFPGGLGRQVEKLRGISVAALKQCRRPYLMGVEKPLDLAALLENAGGRMLCPVFCHPCNGNRESGEWSEPLNRELEYVLVVGPEGGFSSSELELIEGGGFPRLDLGRWWLRSETAVVAGFTLLANRLWGEYGFFHG